MLVAGGDEIARLGRLVVFGVQRTPFGSNTNLRLKDPAHIKALDDDAQRWRS